MYMYILYFRHILIVSDSSFRSCFYDQVVEATLVRITYSHVIQALPLLPSPFYCLFVISVKCGQFSHHEKDIMTTENLGAVPNMSFNITLGTPFYLRCFEYLLRLILA